MGNEPCHGHDPIWQGRKKAFEMHRAAEKELCLDFA